MNDKLLKCDLCGTEFKSHWLNANCPDCNNTNISKMTLIKYFLLDAEQ